ncbi:MDR family MFS transporter [Amycolatopsis sp. CA-126428]|uniref:MDR family MFS transporter n=1 Tax=Amycolatopsis sp. CA-126428 TaxID=2073158 RepID=UPI000CD09C0D|nr:MDR family MFS transporter [Amycolatopsis sp. CA-126428]
MTKNNPDRLDPALRRLIAILIIGAMAPLLDTTIVNVALNTLAHDLTTTVSTVQWITTGYLLAMGMAIPLAGWAVTRIGGKRAWLISLALFLVSSALAGAAWDIGSLIAFRVLQGVAAGVMIPVLQTLVVQAAGGRQMGRLMAAVSMPAVIAPIVGPVLGGLIVGNTSWRWIFLINIPICLAGLVLAGRRLDDTGQRSNVRLDVLGLVLLSPGLAAVLYSLSRFSTLHSLEPAVTVPLVLGLVLLAAFVAHALRTGRQPIIDIRPLAVRSFGSASALMFLSGLTLFGGTLLVPLYLQQVRGLSALQAGLLLVPQGIGALLARRSVGGLTDRIGPRPVVLAGVVLATLPVAVFTQFGAHTNLVLIGACLLVFGAGVSAASIGVLAAAFEGLQPAQIPDASGTTRILLQIGGSFGTSVIALLLARQTAAHPGAPDVAFAGTFWWTTGFVVLAVAPALLLPRRKRTPPEEAVGDPAIKGAADAG